MANRAYLLEADSASPSQDDPSAENALLAASYSVPVLWYALFDDGCILSLESVTENTSHQVYPYLVSTKTNAWQRYLARRQILLNIFPPKFASLFGMWESFLAAIKSEYIHLDLFEIYILDGSGGFSAHVKRCVAAADSSDGTSARWTELLDQALIDPRDIAASTEDHKLAGYGWGRSAPWE